MDAHLRPGGAEPPIRISESPRRSPQITNVLRSPVRGVFPEMQVMESIKSQTDVGLRTTDVLDLSSEDGSTHAQDPSCDAYDVDLIERRASTSKKRRNRKSSPTIDAFVTQCAEKPPVARLEEDGYQRLRYIANQDHIQFAEIPGTFYNGSVDELLPDVDRSSPLQPSHQARGTAVHAHRGSSYIDRESSMDRTMLPSNKVDQILGAHAIAHEITLQALMRDENTLDRSLQSFAPLLGGERASLLPPSLRMHDPRSPRDRTFSTPQSSGSKKVSVLPPPIDTSDPRRSLPAELVRTPYPTIPERVYRKDYGRSPLSAGVSTPTTTESILTLSIRRANLHRLPKVTSLTIPAPNDYSAVRSESVGEKERHFTAIEFDDEHFFRRLRTYHGELSGPSRFFSARSLARIIVSGTATRAADAGYGWLHQPRSPRSLAYKGLNDTFSEEKILQYYRNPRLGRSRYAFVHWAHRLAAAPSVRTPQADDNVEETVNPDLIRRMEQPEGLEFVSEWSVRRILLVLVLVLVVSVAATLLWVFLGRNTTAGHDADGGYRDAGDRVGTGLLLGICSLLIGLSGMVGWLGVSWLVT